MCELSAISLSLTGMVIRPKADETFEIVYTIQDTESWDMYSQALDTFLARKSDSASLTVIQKAYCDRLSNNLQ